MERKFYGRYGIYAPLLSMITLIATTLRTVAAFLGVNDYGFFQVSILSEISAWILVGGVLFALTYPLTQRKARPIYHDDRTPLTYFPAAVLGLCILFFGADLVSDALLLILQRYVSSRTVSATLLLILCVCGVLYAASVCLIEHTASDTRAALGMLTVLLYGVYVAYLHYDTTLPHNAPVKIADQMAYLSFTLFFLYEVRISLKREQWPLYSTFGFIAGALAAYSAIPSFLLYIIEGRVLSHSISETILTLGTLAFIIGRMLVCVSSPEDRPIPLMGEIIRVAEIRDRTRAALAEAATPHTAPSEETEPTAEAAPDSEAVCAESDAPDVVPEDAQITMDLTAPSEDESLTPDFTDTDTTNSDTEDTLL